MIANLFSDIISRKISADIVSENDELIAIKDINPVAPIHILIIPKKVITTVNDASPSDSQLLGNMVLMAKDIAQKLEVAKDGYRLVFNCNEDAGQTVAHIHLHLLAGRKLEWPPG